MLARISSLYINELNKNKVVLKTEISTNAFQSIVVVSGGYTFPLLLSLIELVGPDHGDYEVDLHELLLLGGDVLVGLQLLLDALAELVPVQVSYQLLKSLFIHVIGLLEGVDVQFYEVLVLDGLGQGISSLLAVLYLVEFLVK